MQRIATGLPVYAKDVLLSYSINVLGTIGGTDAYVNYFSDTPTLISRNGTTTYFGDLENATWQSRVITSDWADADGCVCGVKIGSYLYLLMNDSGPAPDAWRLYRFTASNLAAGGTLMTFAGAKVLVASDGAYGIKMGSDGTYLYFSYEAGNSANDYVVAKYSVSGTTATYVSSITCGSTANSLYTFQVRASDGHILARSNGGVYRRFNTSGTLQTTSPTGSGDFTYMLCDWLYSHASGYINKIMIL